MLLAKNKNKFNKYQMDHECKKKNLKLEIKKISFKNIILICEIKMNLEGRKSIYLLLKVKIFFINEQFKGLKISNKK